MNVNKDVPVMFQKLEQFEVNDSRFLKVKIWLMHLGQNLNSSFFEKESVIDAIPTLSNTPILVYIEDNSNDESDFSDHRQVLVREDNKIGIKYLCNAIGVIPETNDAQFEFRICDDGIEREFLTVTGLVWQKWDDPIDIFNRDVVKSQSMEIHDDYEGHFDKDKLFHFTKFKFFGACGLGKDVSPAMMNATIEAQFNYNSIHSEIQNKMEQFKQFSDQNSLQQNDVPVAEAIKEKGGTDLDKVLELLQKYNLTIEDLIAKDIVAEDFSIEELEVKIQSFEVIEEAPVILEELLAVEQPSNEFSLTSSQLEDELRRELSDIETLTEIYWDEVYECPRYYYRDCKPEQNIVVAMDEKNWYLVGFSFSLVGDKVHVDKSSISRYKVDFIPMELSGENEANEMYSELTSKFKSDFMVAAKEKSLVKQFEADKLLATEEISNKLIELQVKFDELETKYTLADSELATKLQEERVASENVIFSSFSSSLTEEEMAEIKSKKSDFSLEEIDEKLCVILGRKNKVVQVANFSKTPEIIKPLGFQIPLEEKKSTGKVYDELFEKHLKKD